MSMFQSPIIILWLYSEQHDLSLLMNCESDRKFTSGGIYITATKIGGESPSHTIQKMYSGLRGLPACVVADLYSTFDFKLFCM